MSIEGDMATAVSTSPMDTEKKAAGQALPAALLEKEAADHVDPRSTVQARV